MTPIILDIKLSIHADVSNVDPYDRHAMSPRVLVEVLQEVSLRHPRRHHAQLGDIGSGAKSWDQVGVI